MPDGHVQRRESIRSALASFANKSLLEPAIGLFTVIGYESRKRIDLGRTPDDFLGAIDSEGRLNRVKACVNRWRNCSFLFQLTNDEIPSLAIGQRTLMADAAVQRGLIESFVFLALDLKGDEWTRTELAAITREINKCFPMPAILLFRHGEFLSIAIIDRRANLRDGTRDVLDRRITVIKDVRWQSPHRAHLEILADLAIDQLGERHRPTNFRELYDAWIEVLSIQALNKRFYNELAWWYFWAIQEVRFPPGGGAEVSKRNAVAVIRLLTRLIFVWFIRHKRLVPDELFEPEGLAQLLKSPPHLHPEESSYYLAILQNLFFATLNTEMGQDEQGRLYRRWAGENKNGGLQGHYLIHSVYRHKELFKSPTSALKVFSEIPFLNGGLFECLDRELTKQDFDRNPELRAIASKEGNGWVLRVDGFSRREDAQPSVPNKLFFSPGADVDLNSELGTSGKRYRARGLLEIFSSYKFTVEENTPLEEEVALDPELLGKVFENLLASYNEDTRTTARKQSGSFYTPREVVNFMVDETLLVSFQRALPGGAPAEQGDRLHRLLSNAESDGDFNAEERETLIGAIESLTIIDPACGSGAFPMGLLNKLVHVLKKLDPDNALWRTLNRVPLQRQLKQAKEIKDPNLREEKIEEAEASLEKFDRDFSAVNYPDYTRKLYLIEKCIHGVDIQPIAVQIAKLRFFIALIVSQKVDDNKPNRNITALPNLETKIVAADALFPMERPRGGLTQTLSLRDPAIDEKEKALIEANERYFTARTGKTKRKWRDRIFSLRDELAVLLENDHFLSPGAARQLVHWNPFDQNTSADFFDPEWMFGVPEGFDIVIGNPPYVRQEDIKHLKLRLKEHFDCYTGTADLYVYFYERSIRLLKPEGAFAFITSNKWYRAKYGEKLREWLNRNVELKILIDFGDEAVFTSIAYPTIVVAKRRKSEAKQPPARDTVQVLNWTQKQPVTEFPAIFAAASFPVPQAALSKDGWQLETPIKRRLLERLRAAGKPLGQYCNGRFYRGILTGLNDAFVIDGSIRERLIAEDPKSEEIIKPFLRGRDVKRWRVEPQDLWLIFTRRGIDIKKYPAIFKHLKPFKERLLPKPADWPEKKQWPGRKPGPYEWYEIQDNIAYWQEFELPKIVYPDIYLHQSFVMDKYRYYLANTCYFIPTDELWLLGLLNSSLIEWFYEQIANRIQNGYLRAFSDKMQDVPIPQLTTVQKSILDTVVSLVIETEDVRLEQLTNALVFELFFADELHSSKLYIFDETERAGLQRLAALKGKQLDVKAKEFLEQAFASSHPLYAMLFDLQGLDVVRVIESRE